MNIFKNRPLCSATVFFILTGFLCLTLTLAVKISLGVILFLSAGVLFILSRRWKRAPYTAITILLCAVQCLLSCLAADLPVRKASSIGAGPVRTTAYVTEVLYTNEGTYGYQIKTETINGDTCRLSYSMTCDIPLNAGDIFVADLTYRSPHPNTVIEYSTPFSTGISGDASPASPIRVIGQKNTPFIYATRCRDYLCGKLDTMFNEDTAAILRAMLLGDRSGISRKDSLSFRRAGITHLLALSGMHITLLALAVRRILELLHVPNKPKLCITILFVCLYSLLVGMPLSILRAAGMTILLLLGGLMHRERDAITSLCGAALIILILSPRAILDIGFWLSVMATLGILLVTEYRIGQFRRRGFGYRILNALLAPMLMTVAASLFTLPITTFIFGEMSLLSFPANLIFPALMNYLIYLGLIAVPLPFLRPLVNLATGGYLKLLERITSVRGVMLSLRPVAYRAILIIAILLIVVFLTVRLKYPRRMLGAIGGILLIAASAVMIPHITSHREISLSYIAYGGTYDEDINDCIIIKNRGRNIVYVSSYLSDSTAYELYAELLTVGVREIDVLYLSHYHSGIPDFLQNLAAYELIYEVAVPPARTAQEREYMEMCRTSCATLEIPLREVSVGEDISCRDATLSPLPSPWYNDGSHIASAAVFTLGERRFYYASCGYYQSTPAYEREYIYTGLTCDTLIFGCHGTAEERIYPHLYPLDSGIKVILFGQPDGSMRGDEVGKHFYDAAEILRETHCTFPCGE